MIFDNSVTIDFQQGDGILSTQHERWEGGGDLRTP